MSDEERKRRSMGTPVWPLSPATYNDKFRQPPYVIDKAMALEKLIDRVGTLLDTPMNDKEQISLCIFTISSVYEDAKKEALRLKGER
jgi:hypothetical protein